MVVLDLWLPVQSVSINTNIANSYPAHGKVYSNIEILNIIFSIKNINYKKQIYI
jgi:hypothetical protein